jgi:hypothetical protein
MLCKIYCLINPIDNAPFYVGSTIGDIKVRIQSNKDNCLPAIYQTASKHMKERGKLIDKILKQGLKIEYSVLFIVDISLRDFTEKAAYEILTEIGYKLLQHENAFHASKRHAYWEKIRSPDFKREPLQHSKKARSR